MLELPFKAKISDRLATMLRRITKDHRKDTPDALPSIRWCADQASPRTGRTNWSLLSLSSKQLPAEDIFTVDDISLHIGVDERQRLNGLVLDWIEAHGLVARRIVN